MLILFVTWYALNCGYNVYNSYSKADMPLPLTLAIFQLLVGLVYAVPMWLLGLRKPPSLTIADIWKLMPVVLVNSIGHLTAQVAMSEKGGGSFTHVIKASEPVVSVLINLLWSGVFVPPMAALSLLPITYGVAYASTLGDLSPAKMSIELTTLAAKMAMISNICFAIRSLLRSNLSKDFKTKANLHPANDHAVITILTLVLVLPIMAVLEGPTALSTFDSLDDIGRQRFLLNMGVCGMCWYLYNEIQNVVLGSLGPVPTAVGNTLKRVVIFVALYLFTEGETFPVPKIVGCSIAVAGCLAFAVFKSMGK
jgi:solute carrier family 35 protein E1